APGRAPARLPLIALPRLGALIALPEVRVGPVEIVSEQHVLVRPHAVRSPDLLAILDVVGGNASADTELATADADDDLVLVDVRGRGHGGADLRVGVLDLPRFLPGFRIQRDQVAVELAQEDFAVGVREPTVDVVAARDGLNAWILLGQIGPLDLT